MGKKKNYQLLYQVEAGTTEEVIALAFELKANTGMEPQTLTLPTGKTIPWYGYAAHQFAAEGRIDEKTFIKMSLSKKS